MNLFQIVIYILDNYNTEDANVNNIMAGFFAGLSYYFHPNVPIAVLAITTTLQVRYILKNNRMIINDEKKYLAGV